MRIWRWPPPTRRATAAEKSPSIGYINLDSPTRTIDTSPTCSVVTFISLSSSAWARTGVSLAAWTVLLTVQLANLARQFVASSVDARFHRAFREPETLRDFLVRQLLNIPQQNGCPQCVGELR